MKHYTDSVKEFYEKFNIEIKQGTKASLGERNKLRFELMKEENEEYLEAVQNDDLVEVADALGDMLYILCGTIIEHGLEHKIKEVFDEIQASNLSKLDKDGKPIINGKNGVLDIYSSVGKILKGENYFKPNIKKVLEK